MRTDDYERVPDAMLDHIIRTNPLAVQTKHQDPRHWESYWRAREINVLLARELREVRTSLRLIAASLPTEYVRTTEPEEPRMDLRITDLHATVLERLLLKPAKVTSATSAATVGALHELQAAGVVCRDLATGSIWSIRED